MLDINHSIVVEILHKESHLAARPQYFHLDRAPYSLTLPAADHRVREDQESIATLHLVAPALRFMAM